jgi:hypothetical protein
MHSKGYEKKKRGCNKERCHRGMERGFNRKSTHESCSDNQDLNAPYSITVLDKVLKANAN